MTNVPRAGSIGERSIEHLKIHGRMTKRDLADAIDADMASMDSSLSLCLKHGLIEEDSVDGKTWFSVQKSADEAQSTDAQMESELAAWSSAVDELLKPSIFETVRANGDKPVGFKVQIGRPEGSGIRVTSLGHADTVPEPEVPAPRQKDAKRRFEFGMFSDGRLVLEIGDNSATLTRDESDRLYQFFRKIDAVGGIA